MSSDSDYLLEQIGSTNATNEPTNSSLLSKIEGLWKQAICYVGKDYIAEFLATFVLMVSVGKLCAFYSNQWWYSSNSKSSCMFAILYSKI